MASNYNIHGTDNDDFYYCPRNDCPCHDGGDNIAPTRSLYDDDPHAAAYRRANDDAWNAVIDDIDRTIDNLLAYLDRSPVHDDEQPVA